MEQLRVWIAVVSLRISTGDEVAEPSARIVPAPICWSWHCTGVMWGATLGGCHPGGSLSEGTWHLSGLLTFAASFDPVLTAQ